MDYRMLKVVPEKLSRHWDILRVFIERTLPPVLNSDARMNSVLASLLTDNLELHQFLSIDDEGKWAPLGFVVLSFIRPADGYGKEMLIYSAYSYKNVGRSALLNTWGLMESYAASKGCSAIVAYTNSESVARLVEGFGADTSYRFLRKEI